MVTGGIMMWPYGEITAAAAAAAAAATACWRRCSGVASGGGGMGSMGAIGGGITIGSIIPAIACRKYRYQSQFYGLSFCQGSAELGFRAACQGGRYDRKQQAKWTADEAIEEFVKCHQ